MNRWVACELLVSVFAAVKEEVGFGAQKMSVCTSFLMPRKRDGQTSGG